MRRLDGYQPQALMARGLFVRVYDGKTGLWDIVGDAYSTEKAAECGLNRVVTLLRGEDDCVEEV